MGFRLGEINGFRIGGTRLTGLSQVVDFGNPELIAKIKQKCPETIPSCKPLDFEKEFENLKLDSLKNDVFESKTNG